MKKLMLASLLMGTVVSSLSFASAGKVLISHSIGVMFSPQPQVVTVSILDDGSVMKEVVPMHSSVSASKEVVATLSAKTLQKWADQIEKFDKTLPLSDAQAGQPECMDAPYSHISIADAKNPEGFEIWRHQGCHTWLLKFGAGREMVQMMLGLVELAR